MAQSLSHPIVHAVFSTKDRRALLRSEEIRSETYSYMADMLKNLQCHPIKIGGAYDHVHILSSLSKNIAFADMIGRVKGSSSKRLSEKGVLQGRDIRPGDQQFRRCRNLEFARHVRYRRELEYHLVWDPQATIQAVLGFHLR